MDCVRQGIIVVMVGVFAASLDAVISTPKSVTWVLCNLPAVEFGVDVGFDVRVAYQQDVVALLVLLGCSSPWINGNALLDVIWRSSSSR